MQTSNIDVKKDKDEDVAFASHVFLIASILCICVIDIYL